MQTICLIFKVGTDGTSHIQYCTGSWKWQRGILNAELEYHLHINFLVTRRSWVVLFQKASICLHLLGVSWLILHAILFTAGCSKSKGHPLIQSCRRATVFPGFRRLVCNKRRDRRCQGWGGSSWLVPPRQPGNTWKNKNGLCWLHHEEICECILPSQA